MLRKLNFKPLGFYELLRLGVTVYFSHFIVFFLFNVILLVFLFASIALIETIVSIIIPHLLTSSVSFKGSLRFDTIFYVSILGVLAWYIYSLYALRVIVSILDERKLRIFDNIISIKEYLSISYFLTICLSVLATLIGFIFLIVPGLLLGMSFAILVPIIFFEKLKYFEAAKRSISLTKGYRLRIFFFFTFLFVANFLITLACREILSILTHVTDKDLYELITNMAGLITGLFLNPLYAIYPIIMYFDIIARKNEKTVQSTTNE